MRTHEETMTRHSGQQGLWVLAAVVVALMLMVNCDSSDDDPVPDAGVADAGTDAGTQCLNEVSCKDQSIDKLTLLTTVSTGEVREEQAAQGEFRTYIDARAGGLTPTMSYTYARFTPQGLAQVSVDDQAALARTDWDIAFRRYYIRVNSGTSGPSCVSVATTPEGTTFESVTAVASTWEFKTEAWYDPACTFSPDDSGLNGPLMRLSTFWTYTSCVQMTGDVFVIRLADGRHVKLEVTGYYDPTPQQVCNETGSVPQPSGSGQLRVRWAFLP
ncbi:HmuY family protein [Pyxidicoccus sp. MSG2]|uniref:HmuY family protein n=1 Tax=Pyxidicoccus sp. MSG2 TaxID=2996790 RepID=UPI00226E157C|nr:HmuY family protein [Pyxidicoccus sp. MSG2]MCY1022724.1 HmuY family protein [Pyxidicoccus sp. MSG2]